MSVAEPQHPVDIPTLAVIGVGLIGGSFAMALKQAGLARRVIGVGRTRENLETALRLGIIDEAGTDPAVAVRGADLVLVAAPVAQIPELLVQIAPALDPHTVVTDAGSTKQDVIAYARRFLGERFRRFVPAHPIAGTEKSGAAAAFPDLYRERNVILTLEPEIDADAVALVRGAWQACGAHVIELDAARHDAIFAAVSHLPHVVAFTLVTMLARRADARTLLGFSGGGLRDTVRIAGSSPEMWRDICIANRDALLPLIDDYMKELELARGAIESGDGDALETMFERARDARRRWLLKEQS
jgi:prephenate dehydrogenase